MCWPAGRRVVGNVLPRQQYIICQPAVPAGGVGAAGQHGRRCVTLYCSLLLASIHIPGRAAAAAGRAGDTIAVHSSGQVTTAATLLG